jgi:ABC-type oligopeptide transport system substrate-binding subunit
MIRLVTPLLLSILLVVALFPAACASSSDIESNDACLEPR